MKSPEAKPSRHQPRHKTDLASVGLSPKVCDNHVVGLDFKGVNERDVHRKPAEHAVRVRLWMNANRCGAVELAVKIAREAVHGSTRLCLEGERAVG